MRSWYVGSPSGFDFPWGSLFDCCVAGCATYAAVRDVDFTSLRCVTMLYFRNIRRQPFQIVLIVFGLLVGTWWFTHDDRQIGVRTYDHLSRPSTPHPLDDVIERAREAHEARLSKDTTGIYGAVYAYRNRRGRHPPPGFENGTLEPREARQSSSRASSIRSMKTSNHFWE